MNDQNIVIGPGFLGLLTILFIGLKLTGHITWSWLWVLAPLWVPVVAVIAIFLGVLFFALLMMALTKE